MQQIRALHRHFLEQQSHCQISVDKYNFGLGFKTLGRDEDFNGDRVCDREGIQDIYVAAIGTELTDLSSQLPTGFLIGEFRNGSESNPGTELLFLMHEHHPGFF